MTKNKMTKSAKTKLLSIVTIILILLCAFSMFSVARFNSKLTLALGNQTNLIVAANGFSDASTYLTKEVRSYAVTGKKEYYDNYWKEVNTDKNREKHVAAMKAIGLTSEESAMVDQISSLSNNLVPLEEEAMELTEQGHRERAYTILYGDQYESGVQQIQDVVNKFDAAIKKRMEAEVSSIYRKVVIFTAIVYVCVGIILCAQICVILFVLKELIDPIIKFERKMKEFSEGNLNGSFELEEDNTEIGRTAASIKRFQQFQKEIIEDIGYLLGEMANGNFSIRTRCEGNYIGDYKNVLLSLRQINGMLSSTLRDIREASEQVNSGADQVSSGAQGLSQGATEQAASVQELSASVADITNDLHKMADQTQTAAELVGQAETALNNGMEEMEEMVKAMHNIERSSLEIEHIVKTIDDIAFQTNILALNAAVEAARAGSAGKGFAVVADEVRNLAQKSAEAAKSTTSLIVESSRAVKEGMDIAERTEGAVGQAAKNSKEAAGIVMNIKNTSYVEVDAANQMLQNIDQISAVVQNNSATAEQSAAASEELSGQANMLKALIGKFRLRDA
ncbi:methyl-accepting chemotaxis protein [Otoolea muris]|uniref:methyl-accepting chemotaxis protein n=1 Tax=Otoolea muris TaxID=2941515 RepID=UPI002041CA3A|nr:methyl-accepting chemotaxis protein [Otoolea muris]